MTQSREEGPRLSPAGIGTGILLVALVQLALAVVLVTSSQDAAVVTGVCLFVVAAIAVTEAAIAFGRRSADRAANLRGAAQLVLACLVGVWLVGMAWLVVTLAFGRTGAAAYMVAYTGLVLPVVVVGAFNIAEANRAVRLRRASRGLP